MRAVVLLLLGLNLLGCVRPDASKILESAATWQAGEPIPPALLEYRAREACMNMPTDSEALIRDIRNFDLLVALVTSSAAPEVVELGFERALLVGGPTRTFAALAATAGWTPPPWIGARAHERHVWLYGVYSVDAGVPAIGNLGDFVISASKRDALPLRHAEIPVEHASALLDARAGEAIIVEDTDRVLMYQIIERYDPVTHLKP